MSAVFYRPFLHDPAPFTTGIAVTGFESAPSQDREDIDPQTLAMPERPVPFTILTDDGFYRSGYHVTRITDIPRLADLLSVKFRAFDV